MKNKEWLATLSAEDFYLEFKKAEKEGRGWTSTSGYVIKWLDEERRIDEPIQIETDREKLIKMTYCRGFNDGFEHAQEVISRFVKAVGYNIIIPKDLYDMEES